MAINERLRELLAEEYAAYRVMPRPSQRNGQALGTGAHLAERDLAKVLALKDAAGQFFMVALPCDRHVDLTAVEKATGREGLLPASEAELAQLFPDCEPGAVPPFGALYGVPLYVDACFRGHPEMFFSGGCRDELIAMGLAEYESLAKPVSGPWCFHAKDQAA